VQAHPPGPNGKVTITTDYPDYVPFLSYARSGEARERLWRVYRQRAHPKNLSVLARMLEKRFELARLLGYPSWAAYVTEDKMIGSAQAAADFIGRIAAAAEKRAADDYQALLSRKRRDEPGVERVEAWDSQVLTEALRKERHGYDAQSVRPYFEMSRVQEGVLDVTARLFGLEYRRAADAPVWHGDVIATTSSSAATWSGASTSTSILATASTSTRRNSPCNPARPESAFRKPP